MHIVWIWTMRLNVEKMNSNVLFPVNVSLRKKVKIKGRTISPRFLEHHLSLVVRLTSLANDRGLFSWILLTDRLSDWWKPSWVAQRTCREGSWCKLNHVEKYLLNDLRRFKILTFSQEWLCDGINDCGLWEDEINCKRKNLVLEFKRKKGRKFAFEKILLPILVFSYP